MLWLTHVASSTQFWMEMVARPWLVYDMTDSVFLLGLVQALRTLPVFFFAALGGVLADRMDRNRLYTVVRAVNAASIIGLTLLLLAGQLEVWHVFALTVLGGIANAMEFPIRQSLIPAVVPKADLMNAVALNSLGRQATHLASPAAAGLLIAAFGIAGCYVAQSALVVVSTVFPYWIRAPRGSLAASEESLLKNVTGALTYLRGEEVVLTLLLLALAQRFFTGAWQTLFAVFARDILQVGEVGFGILNSGVGAGAFLGALVIALSPFRRKGAVLLLGAGLQALGLILFAYSPWFLLSLLLTVAIGIVQTGYFTMNNALLLAEVSEEYRGRVLSLYDMDRGLTMLGAILLAWLADVAGAPMALALLAAPMIPVALAVAWRVPSLRQAD